MESGIIFILSFSTIWVVAEVFGGILKIFGMFKPYFGGVQQPYPPSSSAWVRPYTYAVFSHSYIVCSINAINKFNFNSAMKLTNPNPSSILGGECRNIAQFLGNMNFILKISAHPKSFSSVFAANSSS